MILLFLATAGFGSQWRDHEFCRQFVTGWFLVAEFRRQFVKWLRLLPLPSSELD